MHSKRLRPVGGEGQMGRVAEAGRAVGAAPAVAVGKTPQ